MYKLTIPEGYASKLSLRETEIAIKELKDFFEMTLAAALRLMRVSAPLFVFPESGLNDNLSGVERPVAFDIKYQEGRVVEVVHSLAKWKRHALARYGISPGSGLYADMNAIRRDEMTDNIHSLYVDQWDWELSIQPEQRTKEFLESIVRRIYAVFLQTQEYIVSRHPTLDRLLREDLVFITTQELFDEYPNLTSSERESQICREFGSVFLTQIGGKLASGERHDGRAPDYDDWSLNGDLLFDYPPLGRALELSSMGIRVDQQALLRQLDEAGCPERAQLPFQRELLEGKLPLSIGGGIGQSRLCMLYLQKAHIGEVQASVWPEEMIALCEAGGITLL